MPALAASPAPTRARSVWNDARARRVAAQALLLAIVLAAAAYFWSNAATNMARRGLELGFAFLGRTANFAIGEGVVPYSPADSYGRALLVGVANTVVVAALGCLLTTVLGTILGILRRSRNLLVAGAVGLYVEIGRNVPLLLQLFFWYALITRLGGPRQALSPLPGVFVSNRGLRTPTLVANEALLGLAIGVGLALAVLVLARRWADRRQAASGRRPPAWTVGLAALLLLPAGGVLASGTALSVDVPVLQGFNFTGGAALTPELVALLFGLTFYTSAFVAEIVRAGIASVPSGQWEAGRALGLRDARIMRLVVLPQALRVIIPPLTSQYLNLIKNSSLAVAIGYPDLINISGTVINQTGQALEVIFIFMAVYLGLSLAVSWVMNAINARGQPA